MQTLICSLLQGLCHGVSKATECTARGRFPNNEADDCRGYTMCLLGGASGFTQYNLTCPLSFVYSHLEQKCTNATNYECLPSFRCNTTGKLISNNCSSYIACTEGINEIVTARKVECPTGEVFNPLEAACVNNTTYECTTVTITAEAVTEVPSVTETVAAHNTSYNVQVTGENGFQLPGSVTVNSGVDVSCSCSRHDFLFVLLLVFLICN